MKNQRKTRKPQGLSLWNESVIIERWRVRLSRNFSTLNSRIFLAKWKGQNWTLATSRIFQRKIHWYFSRNEKVINKTLRFRGIFQHGIHGFFLRTEKVKNRIKHNTFLYIFLEWLDIQRVSVFHVGLLYQQWCWVRRRVALAWLTPKTEISEFEISDLSW